MQKHDIPYSEILSYLTQTDKRAFQSLNFASKRLLLSRIDQLNIDPELFQNATFTTYLQWIDSNKMYLTGIVKLRIHASNRYLSRVMTIFKSFELKNIKQY